MLHKLVESIGNKMFVLEPGYEQIPSNVLRRMGKAVRMGVGAAMLLLNDITPDGIIIGTANGGMEDCIKFLNQIINYEEGILTPGNFVQSTPNSIAAQVSMLSSNKGYNITHVHRGLAFENAIIDTGMLVNEFPANQYLLGGVDEISAYNYNIDRLAGWHKKEPMNSSQLFSINSTGCIAGEGAAMFLVNGNPDGALARLKGIKILHTESADNLGDELKKFLMYQLMPGEKIDLFLSGENGDNRYVKYSDACEAILDAAVTVARFKHMTGEFATVSAISLWLCCQVISSQDLPLHMVKQQSATKKYQKVLIYNNYKSLQHSFMLVEGGLLS
ncbi:MAG: beta-ketoacyl synthase chain length factor [Chitinophagaceae bacterium]